MTKEFFQLLVEQLVTPDFGMFAWLEETRCFWFASTGAALEAEAEFLLVGLVGARSSCSSCECSIKYRGLTGSHLGERSR